MNNIQRLTELGQSIWLDYIRRSFISSGELSELVENGVSGVTSNPSIFQQAIAGSADYDDQLMALVDSTDSAERLFEQLAIEDIRDAADVLRPIYDESGGSDGFVSLEVSPDLARDTEGTIGAAKRLFAEIDRHNVMIKIPATAEGIPAIRASIAAGINVNVTLIFSLDQYEQVSEAYLSGLEDCLSAGGEIGNIASVASVFISRIDGKVDARLEGLGDKELRGTIAIANAKAIYARFRELFSGERWQKLTNAGACVQRPLWASTKTKNAEYSDTLYVDELIGPDTVNTVPQATLQSFLDHGTPVETVTSDVDVARANLAKLKSLNIDLGEITGQLLDDGVKSFADDFAAMLETIDTKRAKLKDDGVSIIYELGDYQQQVDSALKEVRDEKIMQRIWEHDHTVWKPEPNEITNRLGWLYSADTMRGNVKELNAFAEAVREDDISHALVLGMGGSSLAPEVFAKAFGSDDGITFDIVDTTDPDAIAAIGNRIDEAKTLFIVSTKSGGTVETFSAFKHFYNATLEAVGEAEAGKHFAAITDPGSKLVDVARQYGFRATFLNDPNIGGRYSALSYFGLVPAALIGVDIDTLLNRAQELARNGESCNCPLDGDNHCAELGVVMGELAKAGRDKITLITSEQISGFGDWVEQLIAESTGKEGKGILPVVGEPLGEPDVYGYDRLFAFMILRGDDQLDSAADSLRDAGHPVVRLYLEDVYDMGGQYFLWELATVVAGQRLRINPFDQPNVESAKVLARGVAEEYGRTGKLPDLEAAFEVDGVSVYGDIKASSVTEAFEEFLEGRGEGAYISLQAYVDSTEKSYTALSKLAAALRDRTGAATTIGFGPRFLHSTGQLHKGDGGNGLFVQIVSEAAEDVPIPDDAGSKESSMSFGVLKLAQALGDRQALIDNGRMVIQFRCNAADVLQLIDELSS